MWAAYHDLSTACMTFFQLRYLLGVVSQLAAAVLATCHHRDGRYSDF